MSRVSISENQRRAPHSARFVNVMREVFGEVKVLFVQENDVLLGEPQPSGASCFVVPPLEKRKKAA